MAESVPEQIAVVSFPGADYTQRAVLSAARNALPTGSTTFVTDIRDGDAAEQLCQTHSNVPIVFFSDYDILPFDALLRHSERLLCSSYIIRKALIRKNYLAHSLHAYRLKHEGDALNRQVVPTTWHIDINFADELDELLMDDLYDLNAQLEENESREVGDRKWFILKPAMADRGNGIRLFSTVSDLRDIFEAFEDNAEDDEDEGDEDADSHNHQAAEISQSGASGHGNDTAVMTSQLRHFVIQEYVSAPLLLSPPSESVPSSARKFHLRAYVLCVAGLRVYLADEMLALFAPLPYRRPGEETGDDAHPSDDLGRHLTNTCLQSKANPQTSKISEENVFLFSELEGMQRSSPVGHARLSRADLDHIKSGVVDVLATTFTACATAGSVHWQMWPNAFEVFGIDLLVESVDSLDSGSSPFKVWLLEVNAQPDFAQTGSRLEPTIEHLFRRVFDLAVVPFLAKSRRNGPSQPSELRQSADGMTLCLELQLSNAWS